MTLSISNAAAIARLDALVDLADAGAGDGILTIYDGTEPANVDTAITSQNALAVITLNDPAFGAAVDATPNATATLDLPGTIEDASADANGTASFWRIEDSNGLEFLQGDCGTSGADMIMPSLTITATLPVEITSCVITEPEA